jgi:bifunctional non-homologous end joining protein LigD
VIAPMLAVPGHLPTDDHNWAYETKWDGMRAIAIIDRDGLKLMSRNDRDVSVSFPELAPIAEATGVTQLVLDGEIVALGSDGRPSFGRLQRRMHVSNVGEASELSRSDPVIYIVFDLLYLDNQSALDLPYHERRELLDGLGLADARWPVPPYFAGGGPDALQASKELHLEGIVAKRLDSSYRPGQRSPNWRKIKNIRTQEVVIGGWKPGSGNRATTIGSLLLGIPSMTGLTYVGKVGTGFTMTALESLQRQLRQSSTSPFENTLTRAEAKDARWVTPSVVGEVAFSDWTDDARLRHPVWRGLRPDKARDDVVIEG